jgi:uncharacterized coiled-coil protein SlyX
MSEVDVEQLWAMKESLEATCAHQEAKIRELKSELSSLRKVSAELAENALRLRIQAREWEGTATELAAALGRKALQEECSGG